MKNFKIVWKVRLVNQYGHFYKEVVHVNDVKAENSIEAIDKMFGSCPNYIREKISDISVMEC
jgi:hypothetical protein